MKFTPTSIPDVVLIEPEVIGDRRGFFLEAYNKKKFIQGGIPGSFIQDNHSGSQQGTLRGLHYQIRHTQGKLIRVVIGEIFDVAVDLRKSSATFGQWIGTILSGENKRQLWIPKGFAHGFYVLSDWAEVLYKVTEIYAPEWDRTLFWNDPEINIDWPLLEGHSPLLSEKDKQGKFLREAELFE